ncbi:hypothetical protein NV379_02275 [Paenibacillus sp. N1-5-1-14]|uniref:hypothetical protein n=1 Tax=Paenibacillus radicibacter TaxID=2972488 RepID=UPI0021596231|nr:hypothetical protein [Paenibacillus radicibacter]MCR8641473.1 hypothetical protein [Paenibacillus radicibacter]
MGYIKIREGTYRMSSVLSGIDAAHAIKDIISSERGIPPLRFEFDHSTGGFADVLGMYAKQQLGIGLEVDFDQKSGRLVMFYLNT